MSKTTTQDPRAWLHFIGASYYPTWGSFVSEASAVAVTRRVSLKVLKALHVGDIVVCAHRHRKEKTPIAFGEFIITGLSGLTAAEMCILRDAGLVGAGIHLGGSVIKRGCGSYVEGPTHVLLGDLADAVQVFEDASETEGLALGKQVMVKGIWHSTYANPIRLLDIKTRQGFRQIDRETLQQAAAARPSAQNGIRSVHGHFYTTEEKEAQSMDRGIVQEVAAYSRKK